MGSGIAPKQFMNPAMSAFGGSQGSNIVQQATAAPQIQGPALDPLNSPVAPPVQAQPQPAPPQDQQQNPIANPYRTRYGSFYGNSGYQLMNNY